MHSGFSGHGDRKLATWVALGGMPSSLRVAQPSLAHFWPLDSSGCGTMLTLAAPASTEPAGMLPAKLVAAEAASPAVVALATAFLAPLVPEVVTLAGFAA